MSPKLGWCYQGEDLMNKVKVMAQGSFSATLPRKLGNKDPGQILGGHGCGAFPRVISQQQTNGTKNSQNVSLYIYILYIYRFQRMLPNLAIEVCCAAKWSACSYMSNMPTPPLLVTAFVWCGLPCSWDMPFFGSTMLSFSWLGGSWKPPLGARAFSGLMPFVLDCRKPYHCGPSKKDDVGVWPSHACLNFSQSHTYSRLSLILDNHDKMLPKKTWPVNPVWIDHVDPIVTQWGTVVFTLLTNPGKASLVFEFCKWDLQTPYQLITTSSPHRKPGKRYSASGSDSSLCPRHWTWSQLK